MAGVAKSSIILEKKGLRSCDHTRPGDIVALDFFGLGRHLVIDAVVSTVYGNTILSKTSTIPGYVAKLAEDKKFKAGEKSPEPVSSKHGGDHVFVPFAMEDGGTLGAHALALLKMLAEYAVAQGCYTKCTDELPHGSVDLLLLLLLVCANDKLNAWFCDSFARQTVLVATDPTRRHRHCLIATVVSSSSSSSSPLLFFALLPLLSSSLPPPPPPPRPVPSLPSLRLLPSSSSHPFSAPLLVFLLILIHLVLLPNAAPPLL